jgi:oligosaccharide repeat unit polymerase
MNKIKAMSWPRPNISFLVLGILCSAVFLLLDFGRSLESIELKIAYVLTIFSIAAGADIIYSYVKKTGILFDGYILIWFCFLTVYAVSASFHLLNTTSDLQGFYDMTQSGSKPMMGRIYHSLLIVTIAFIALRVGTGTVSHKLVGPAEPLKVNYRLLLVLGVLFTVASLIGTMKLFGGFPSLQTFLTVDRLRETGGGTARYVFISQWLGWGLTFLTVYFLHTSAARKRSVFLLWFILSACAVSINLFWTGSRGAAVISLLPGLLLLQRLRPKYVKSVLVVIGILFLVYFSACTYLRSENFADYRPGEQLTAVFDWQVGRFSMIGLGIEMVQQEGLAFGATLADGFFNTINAPSTLLKLPLLLPVPQSATSVVGNYLLGDPEITGIVPGSIFDFYYNFGLIGVAAGYFIIGKIVQKSITIMRKTDSMGVFFFWSYVIVTICVCCIPGTATGWVYYLATTGFPALCFLMCEVSLSRNKFSILSFVH